MRQPQSDVELDEMLSKPTAGLLESMSGVEGDVLVLGAAGKMGPTLARMARRALPQTQQVIAISRFSKRSVQNELEKNGVKTIRCDLLNRDQVATLPDANNVIFMAGHKFGTAKRPDLSWMMNAIVPNNVCERYRHSRIVAFSTGCVYPLVDYRSGRSVETDTLGPPGEYANSCVARERVFSYYAREFGTLTLLYRLSYAVDLRYGVMHDIASRVWSGEPLDVSMGYVNLIWQGDANARALQCLNHVDSPTSVLNVTGPEIISVRELAQQFGKAFEKTPCLIGTEAETA